MKINYFCGWKHAVKIENNTCPGSILYISKILDNSIQSIDSDESNYIEKENISSRPYYWVRMIKLQMNPHNSSLQMLLISTKIGGNKKSKHKAVF